MQSAKARRAALAAWPSIADGMETGRFGKACIVTLLTQPVWCAVVFCVVAMSGCADKPHTTAVPPSAQLHDSGSGQAPGLDAGLAPPSDSWLIDAAPLEIACGADAGLEVYERRIAPLFTEDRPQSCSQCHLAGLDLSLFVRDTPCQTFACLSDLGLVDERSPDDSQVLRWIGRAEPQSSLITERIIREEYEAFRLWIHTQVACDECRDVSCPSSGDAGTCAAGPAPGADVDLGSLDPEGCSDTALYELFENTVYASRGRCGPCHESTADFERLQAPQWLEVRGDCRSAARRTLWNIYEGGYLDMDDPERSLLLTKPLPESQGGVAHGGGAKFHDKTRDSGYLAFAYFIERFATCQGDADAL